MDEYQPTGDPATDAKQMTDSIRASNRRWEERTGQKSSVTEAQYLAAEAELRQKLEKLAKLAPPRLAKIDEPAVADESAVEPAAAIEL